MTADVATATLAVMRILVSNDDGVYAPGLAALAKQMRHLGEVTIVAPITEQSGVGHSITYLTPLMPKSIHRDGQHWAWAVDGSPADCVKWAVAELMKDAPPDLVVSGINNGLNAGINVLYSGTVAAAIEGAFFGIPSVAVSLERSDDDDFDAAAVIAKNVVAGIMSHKTEAGGLFNLNVPVAATEGPRPVKVVPMGTAQYGRKFERRTDPNGRDYFWAAWSEPDNPPAEQSDLTQLRQGNITLTPMHFNLTRPEMIEPMRGWDLVG